MREPEKGFYCRYSWHNPSRQTVLHWRVGLMGSTSCWEYEFPNYIAVRWKSDRAYKQRSNRKSARAEFGANTCPTLSKFRAGEYFSLAPLSRVNIRDFSQITWQMATGALSIGHFLLNCARINRGINRVLLYHWEDWIEQPIFCTR